MATGKARGDKRTRDARTGGYDRLSPRVANHLLTLPRSPLGHDQVERTHSDLLLNLHTLKDAREALSKPSGDWLRLATAGGVGAGGGGGGAYDISRLAVHVDEHFLPGGRQAELMRLLRLRLVTLSAVTWCVHGAWRPVLEHLTLLDQALHLSLPPGMDTGMVDDVARERVPAISNAARAARGGACLAATKSVCRMLSLEAIRCTALVLRFLAGGSDDAVESGTVESGTVDGGAAARGSGAAASDCAPPTSFADMRRAFACTEALIGEWSLGAFSCTGGAGGSSSTELHAQSDFMRHPGAWLGLLTQMMADACARHKKSLKKHHASNAAATSATNARVVRLVRSLSDRVAAVYARIAGQPPAGAEQDGSTGTNGAAVSAAAVVAAKIRCSRRTSHARLSAIAAAKLSPLQGGTK